MRAIVEKKQKEAGIKFEEIKKKLTECEEQISKLREAHGQLITEATRLQGEYRGYQAILDDEAKELDASGNGESGSGSARVIEAKNRIGTSGG